jgi:hypothetical protein
LANITSKWSGSHVSIHSKMKHAAAFVKAMAVLARDGCILPLAFALSHDSHTRSPLPKRFCAWLQRWTKSHRDGAGAVLPCDGGAALSFPEKGPPAG